MSVATRAPFVIPEIFRSDPFPPWPYYADDEIEAALQVLRSGRVNYWTGKEGVQFEEEFAEYVGARHAIAVANGTVALELALVALGIGPGDEVITTCRTFIASASCVAMRGATPVVVDVDPISQNLTAETIRPHITERTRAIIAVHLAGWPCDMDSILKLAREHDLNVVEDCAQAHGAHYKGRHVGTMGDLGAFSFCQDKIITTAGEGGMVITNDETLWDRAWSFKDHGKDHTAMRGRPAQSSDRSRYVHRGFGTNWRLTEMQSAVGRVQLRKLDRWVERRRANAQLLTDGFSRIPGLAVRVPPADVLHSYYVYYVFVEPEALRDGWNRDRILGKIMVQGVPCYTGICPEIYREKAFAEIGPTQRRPVAKLLGETSLMFPVHPYLGETEMRKVVAAVTKVMQRAVP